MSCIWIKLYIGQSDPNPRVFDIDGSPRNISRMKTKIKEAGQNCLAHCDAFLLDVYPRKTSVPISKDVQPIDPGDPVPGGTTSSAPLIVIAPENQQQQHGEFCCLFCMQVFAVRTRIELNGRNGSILVLFYSKRLIGFRIPYVLFDYRNASCFLILLLKVVVVFMLSCSCIQSAWSLCQ